jgi:hypothetical protein
VGNPAQVEIVVRRILHEEHSYVGFGFDSPAVVNGVVYIGWLDETYMPSAWSDGRTGDPQVLPVKEITFLLGGSI